MGAFGGFQGGENTEFTAYSTANESHASYHIIIGTTWGGTPARRCYLVIPFYRMTSLLVWSL